MQTKLTIIFNYIVGRWRQTDNLQVKLLIYILDVKTASVYTALFHFVLFIY